MHILGAIFGAFSGSIWGPNWRPFLVQNDHNLASCEIILRIIYAPHLRPLLGPIWGHFRGIFAGIFRAILVDVSSGIGHQQQPRVRVIILVYVHQWPFRATGAPSVCFCPLGQKHTRSTCNLPFRANCMCSEHSKGPLGPFECEPSEHLQRPFRAFANANIVCAFDL